MTLTTVEALLGINLILTIILFVIADKQTDTDKALESRVEDLEYKLRELEDNQPE